MSNERLLFSTLSLPKHNQKFRIAYMGGKQQYASKIMQAMIDDFSNATSFIDVFGGGGSMSFLALQCGFEKVIYNDLDYGIYLIINHFANGGVFETEWLEFCTREKFKECLGKNDLKSEIWKICYSFGNKRTTYFCSPANEAFKKQAHNFVIFYNEKATDFLVDYFKPFANCYREFKDYCLSNKLKWWERRLLYTQITLKIEFVFRLYELGFGDKLNDFQKYNLEAWKKIGNKELLNIIIERIGREALLPHCKIYKGRNKKQPQELKQLQKIKYLQQLQQMEDLEQLSRLQQLENLEQLSRLQQLERLGQLSCLQQLQQIERLEQLQPLQHLQQLGSLQQLQQIERLEQLQPLQHLQRLESLQQLKGLKQIEQLERLEHLQNLSQLKQTGQLVSWEVFNLDYKHLSLDKNAIIYLDPPYKDTAGYRVGKFNHDEFYEYFSARAREGYNIYLSERSLPPIPYKIIWEDKVENKLAYEKATSIEYLFKFI